MLNKEGSISLNKYIIANWKMNLLQKQADNLIEEIISTTPYNVQIVICPPFTLLSRVGNKITTSSIELGAQDCSMEEGFGSRTGDISAKMLKDCGAEYVILGHSERRIYHNESDQIIEKKLKAAINNALIPILCIGESLEERERGNFEEIIGKQLKVLEAVNTEFFFVAYEPIWAIGTGKLLNMQEIAQAGQYIINICQQRFAKKPKILYGGSVNSENSYGILSLPEIDGVLVGSASLDTKIFIEMCKG